MLRAEYVDLNCSLKHCPRASRRLRVSGLGAMVSKVQKGTKRPAQAR